MIETESPSETANPQALGETPSLPPLGHRNYWYPVVEARRVSKKPISVRVLGEDLVLFRAGDRVAALADRCPHRGTRLSLGQVLFPGTLSCPYHGWTFNPDGECVAAIVEGPSSPIPGTVRVSAYPTEERFGIVWAYIGEGQAPPLDEDLPPELRVPGVLTQSVLEPWHSDWRNNTENYPDFLHATFVHRDSWNMLFSQTPAWGHVKYQMLPDKKGFRCWAEGAALQADFPGAGRFPTSMWWRRKRRAGPPGSVPTRHAPLPEWRPGSGDVRMPGYIVVTHTWQWGVPHCAMQWPVPVDVGESRTLLMNISSPPTVLHRLLMRIWFNLYYRHVHAQFVHQDRRIQEGQNYRNPERLAASDAGVVMWRRFAAMAARQP
jgi:phenylpropionate dioxygenase-like ring-hydroxylating dioxygenase large terminal subunit